MDPTTAGWNDPHYVWQDKDVRFDIPPRFIACRSGEVVVDKLDSVEDTKGNNGDRGRLLITNLRLVWYSSSEVRTNISLGYNCIISITQREAQSRLRGRTEALFILVSNGQTRFEFIFTNLVVSSPRLFSSVSAVHKAYESSKMYREVKLRGALMHNKRLRLLPQEQIFTSMDGVWNLSADQGNLGTFIVTNVRLVWHASVNETFNVSIPYLQLQRANIRDSKFGRALVLQTLPSGGNFVLGFRVDPPERLEELLQEIQTLFKIYKESPVFGIQVERMDLTKQENDQAPHLPEFEEQEDDDQEPLHSDAYLAYFADGGRKERDHSVIFDEDLQLAVEKLPDGLTMEELWEAVPQNKKDKKKVRTKDGEKEQVN